MTPSAAPRGSIWSVPLVGTDALALIISPPRARRDGRLEYQIVPVTPHVPGKRPHTAGDFLIRPEETSRGIAYLGALWNARPVLDSELGHQIDQIMADEVLTAIRDAHLRRADPHILVPQGRLGTEPEATDISEARAREVVRWHVASGPALRKPSSTCAWAEYVFATCSLLSTHDVLIMQNSIEQAEASLGDLKITAAGESLVVLQVKCARDTLHRLHVYAAVDDPEVERTMVSVKYGTRVYMRPSKNVFAARLAEPATVS